MLEVKRKVPMSAGRHGSNKHCFLSAACPSAVGVVVGLAVENVLQRVLQLPVVSSTQESLQRTYASTKEAHPLVASVCEAYEKGVQGASSLAAWSMEPVVRRLEPQFSAANTLACRGLDHLEQKIPALQYPVEKIASELKDSISTPLQSAKSTIGSSVLGALDKILGLAAEGYELTRSTATSTAEYAWSSRVSQMAATGVDTALGKLEKLVAFLLPEEDCQPAQKPAAAQGSKAAASQAQPELGTLHRIGTLTSTVSYHAYQQAARAIQHTKAKGQELALWIPGLGGMAKQSTAKAQQVLSDVQHAASAWLSRRQSKEPEQQPKKEMKKKESEAREKAESSKIPSLVGSMAQTLQAAYLPAISSMKKVPSATWDAAGGLLQLTPNKAASIAREKVGALGGTLRSALGILSHYVPLPSLQLKEKETPCGSKPIPGLHKRKEGSKPETPLAQEKVLLRVEWRASRGHHPLSFLDLEDPLFLQPFPFQRQTLHRALALEPEYTISRKSTFSPYSSRRVSEGLHRFCSEPIYTRAHYSSLYSTAIKKD
ncbi:perilipin-1 isoform X2 [Alligator sinensis]|uniref:Perilipin-1 isoform X2 n=1 Tax=Alligator sinensis TaxID=38654 RepID=A0A3Q0H4Y9_ALLSI|nr:perilipin-1 isoform X2 [Alligator sinensis]